MDVTSGDYYLSNSGLEISSKQKGIIMDVKLKKINSINFDLYHKSILDYGCKTGEYTNAFIANGISNYYGIDILPEYINQANLSFKNENRCSVIFMLSDSDGLINLPSESIDFIFMNEVISHIHYKYLSMIFIECYRILKKNGVLYISDGNKINNSSYKKTFPALYQLWENGPNGSFTGRDHVTVSFRERRKNIIKDNFPQLDENTLDYLSENTFLLNEFQIIESVKKYLDKKPFVERKFISGICPLNPIGDGFLMERSFHTKSLQYRLAEFNFKVKTPYFNCNFRTNKLKQYLHFLLSSIWYNYFDKKQLIVYAEKR